MTEPLDTLPVVSLPLRAAVEAAAAGSIFCEAIASD